jgi:exonuclease VII large subunit
MANSKLLKEAIADAKAVRETAIANAKIALEEAFTPRLQSILSRKLQAEMEGEDEETMEEEMHSMDLDMDDDDQTAMEGDYVDEEEEMEMDSDESMEENDGVGYDDPTNADDASIDEEDEMGDEDELDLESIIRELEMGMDSDEEEVTEEDEMGDESDDEMEMEMEPAMDDQDMEMDDEIDLEEILREMGYGDDDADEMNEEEEDDNSAEMEAELEEAYSVIKQLQSTINEVNLLNAKLLYANKLFRGYNLTNEQKGKVVENLDRTTTVREVKLVFATLSESMNFSGTERKGKRAIAESVASRPIRSTAPKKEIISESTNEMAARFKELANIK